MYIAPLIISRFRFPKPDNSLVIYSIHVADRSHEQARLKIQIRCGTQRKVLSRKPLSRVSLFDLRRDALANVILGLARQMREELAHERAVFTSRRKSQGHLPDVVSGLLQHPAIRVGRIFTNKLLLAHTTLDAGNNAVLLFPAQHQATPARCTAPLDLHLFFLPSLGAGRAEGEFEFLGPHDEGSRRRFAYRPPWIRASGSASVPKAIGTPASDSRARLACAISSARPYASASPRRPHPRLPLGVAHRHDLRRIDIRHEERVVEEVRTVPVGEACVVNDRLRHVRAASRSSALRFKGRGPSRFARATRPAARRTCRASWD